MEAKEAIKKIIKCFEKGGMLFACGNGGSASMSNHLVAEFICKFERDRESLPAISLSANEAVITAIANDYGYEEVFSRQLSGLGEKGDVLIIFTTSKEPTTEHSWNILRAKVYAELNDIEVIEAPIFGNSTAEIQEYQLHWLHKVARGIDDIICS